MELLTKFFFLCENFVFMIFTVITYTVAVSVSLSVHSGV